MPHLNYYTYLGVKFTCNGHWDAHLKDLVTSGKRKLNSLLRILCNPSLSLYLRRQVILSILRPSLEYGIKVWRCTSTKSKALDAVLLGACKKILCYSSKTCNEAVWGDLGVEPLALRRAKSKVVWYRTGVLLSVCAYRPTGRKYPLIKGNALNNETFEDIELRARYNRRDALKQ